MTASEETCGRLGCRKPALYALRLLCPNHGEFDRYGCAVHTARIRSGSGACARCHSAAGRWFVLTVVSVCTAVLVEAQQ